MKTLLSAFAFVLVSTVALAQSTGNETIDRYMGTVITYIEEGDVYVFEKGMGELSLAERRSLYAALVDHTGYTNINFRPDSERPSRYQRAVSPYARPKDPGVATLLSVIVVGGGHFYAGESGTGMMLLLGSGLSLGTGWLIYSNKLQDAEPYETVSAAPLTLGTLGSVALWITGMATASKAAHRFNDRHGFYENVSISPAYQNIEGRDIFGAALKINF